MKKLWCAITPWTRRIIVICCAVTAMTMIICSALTGSMVDLFNFILEVLK